MANYFSSPRRKFGVGVLLVAMLFMAGWIRSLFVDDFYEWPFANVADDIESMRLTGIATRNQSLHLYLFSRLDSIFSSEPVATAAQQVRFIADDVDPRSDVNHAEGIELAIAQSEGEQQPLTLFFSNGDGSDPTTRSDFGDEHLHLLHSIDGLTRLSLSNTLVTDSGYKGLIGLKLLDTLLLGGTATTDAGLHDIAQLENLAVLNLAQTRISDAGIKNIKKLSRLDCLDVSSTSVTDIGLKEICDLTNLRNLMLVGTQITDEGLEEIRQLHELRQLDLKDTPITDIGLKKIARLPNLNHLDLSGTNITDAGLKDLATLKSLQSISLVRTQTTSAAMQELKKSIPELQIIRSDE